MRYILLIISRETGETLARERDLRLEDIPELLKKAFGKSSEEIEVMIREEE